MEVRLDHQGRVGPSVNEILGTDVRESASVGFLEYVPELVP